MSNLSNTVTIDQLIASAKDLGTAEGAGVNSRPELALAVAEAAMLDTISLNKGSEDVRAIWNAFYQAQQEARGDLSGAKQPTETVQVSKLTQIAKCGAMFPNVDGHEMLTRARTLINTTEGVRGSTFDNLVKVAREQLKLDRALTDDEIKGHVVPTETELSDLEREIKVIKSTHDALEKLVKGTKENSPRPSPEAVRSVEALAARLAELDVMVKLEAVAAAKAAQTNAQARAATKH